MIRSCCTARIGPHTCNIDRRLQNFSCRDAHKVAKDLSLSARSFCLPYRFNVLRCFKFRQSTAFCRLFFFCLYLSSNPRTARERERKRRSTSQHIKCSSAFHVLRRLAVGSIAPLEEERSLLGCFLYFMDRRLTMYEAAPTVGPRPVVDVVFFKWLTDRDVPS